GLRRTELANLRWGHVDLPSAKVRVFGKGEKPAEVGLGHRVLEALFEWRARCALGLSRPVAAGDPVFPRTRAVSRTDNFAVKDTEVRWSEPLRKEGIWQVIRSRGEQAG